MKKKFRRKYWVNLAMVRGCSGGTHLWVKKGDAVFNNHPDDRRHIRRIEVREL